MAYTEEQLREALLEAHVEQAQEDSGSAVDWLIDILKDGYNKKGINQMTLEEMEGMVKEDGHLCMCSTEEKKENDICEDCKCPYEIDTFVKLWTYTYGL